MNLTLAFVLGIVALVTIFDVWTLAKNGYSTTISWQTLVWSRKWPVIPFLIGLLAGHLFFPNRAGTLDCDPEHAPAIQSKG